MKKYLVILFIAGFAMSAFSQSNFQDVVYLKDGSIIRGVIIEQVPGKSVKIETSNNNVFVYQMDDIEKLAKERVIEEKEKNRNNKDAQGIHTGKGKVIIGIGSNLFPIAYSSYNNDPGSDGNGIVNPSSSSSVSFNISPRVGYFFINNFALGLDFSIGLSSSKYDYGKNSSTSLGIGPFVRYYISTPSLLPFFELNGSIGKRTNKIDLSDNSIQDDYEYKYTDLYLGGGIGLAIPLGEKVTFDFIAGYNYRKIDIKDSDASYNYGKLRLIIGFSVFL